MEKEVMEETIKSILERLQRVENRLTILEFKAESIDILDSLHRNEKRNGL